MPLVRIALREGKTEEYRKALGDGVHRALIEAMDAPAQDRFQVITEHPAGGRSTIPHILECSGLTTL
jgi:4-oxalocrotonate tautomerase